MPDENLLLRTEVEWTRDILRRIREVLVSSQTDADKLHAIEWFSKQGLKGVREGEA